MTRHTKTHLRCSSVADMISAVRAGVGLSALTCLMGEAHDDLVRVAPDKIFSSTDIWLLAHPDLRDTAPIRAVMDFIVDRAKEDRAILYGKA